MQNTNGKRTTNKWQTNGRPATRNRQKTAVVRLNVCEPMQNIFQQQASNKPATNDQEPHETSQEPRTALYIHHRNWMQHQWQKLRLSSVKSRLLFDFVAILLRWLL
jgi:hypothetical protein